MADSKAWPAFSRGEPWWGVPRQTTRCRYCSQGELLALGVPAGAADDQAAHAVPDQGNGFHRHRPGRAQFLQQSGELLAIGGDMAAGVVAQVERGEAQVILQVVADARAALAAPAQFRQAQPVHQHDDVPARLGQRCAQCRGSSASAPLGSAAPSAWPAHYRSLPGGRRIHR